MRSGKLKRIILVANGGNRKREGNRKYKDRRRIFADLRLVVGSEQGGIRPVLILRVNKLDNGATVICAPLSSNIEETEVIIRLNECAMKLSPDYYVILEQIRAIDKRRLLDKVAALPDDSIELIRKSILAMY